MPSKSEDHRLSAEGCLSVAEQTTDPATKTLLLGMALAWRNLAEHADRNSQLDLVYETPPPEQQQPSALASSRVR